MSSAPTFTLPTPKGPRRIGIGEPCFIVAEMSGNHNHNFQKAVDIIHAAAEAGADAVKLQTYTPDTITIDCNKEWFIVRNKENPELWQEKTLYDLYQTAYTPWEWQPELKRIAEEKGMILFSTPFDTTAVDFLEKMDVPCFKIAAYECTDFLLLRRIAQTKRPVIMSVGFATEAEVRFAVETLRQYGTADIVILHCVTSYSDQPNIDEMNLRTMLDIRDRFDALSGFSDNNAGIEIPLVAATMGAQVIEKHVIMSRDEGGPDARFSLEPHELKELVTLIRRAERIMGTVRYGSQSEHEEKNKIYRRSLFVVADMKKGDTFTEKTIRSIRPAYGLETKQYDEILGLKAASDIERGTPLSWDLIG